MSEIQELIERLKATLPSRDDTEWADAAQYWCSELSMQDVIDTVAALERMREALEEIAALDDEMCNEWLEKYGDYSAFDEPDAVRTARRALNRG